MVSFLLWQQWQLDYAPKPVQSTEAVETQPSSVPSSVPSATPDADVPVAETAQAALPELRKANGGLVKVETDTLSILIDTVGGDIVSANLVQIPVSQDSTETFSLLRPGINDLYVAQSGLIGVNGPDSNPEGRPLYAVEETSYTMTSDTLTIPMKWVSKDGMTVTKRFVFNRDSYLVNVEYDITNNAASAMQVQQYGQIKQSLEGPESSVFMPTYRGAAFSTDEIRYEKLSFDDIGDENLKDTSKGGWVAMLEHYFVSAFVPPQDETNELYSRAFSDRYAAVGYIGEAKAIQPGEVVTITSGLYLGPKDQDSLAKIAHGLEHTVDYGPLWFISQPLFKLLEYLHSLVGNWGLAIVLITIIVKGAMYWLTKKQYESMAKMRNLAPKMAQLKERFGDDRQKMSQGMMELYKKEKVNPMGGCFPLLLQMPIFLALYWVLLESVELRHAEFFLWITDLSVKDPYFVLPVLTGASMYLLQKLQPMTIQDPMQQKIMQLMPVFMSIFFLWFPAGLVLYWFISNVITLIQAKIIYSSMEKRGLKTS